jgi:hypothetical protein
MSYFSIFGRESFLQGCHPGYAPKIGCLLAMDGSKVIPLNVVFPHWDASTGCEWR